MLAAWQSATALSLAVMALGALAPQGAGAQSRDEGRRTTIYRCDGGASPVYSDAEQRCPGQTVATNPQPSPKPIIGPTTQRLTANGPPCPLPMVDPQGPAWSTLRVCYDAALQQQPEHKVGEQQLAGMLMGQCERETQALIQGKDHAEVLGRAPEARRTAIRRWAQWLVQQSGRAADSVPVQPVALGRAVSLSRLSGPMELQLSEGQVVEALNGTLVRPGDQLYVRKGVSFWLGQQAIPPSPQRDRCVRVD